MRECVALDGTVFEGRGLLLQTGANGTNASNRDYLAICLLIGPGQTPTEAMVEAARSRIAIVRHFQPQATKIVGHKDLKPTTCPGPEVTRMIRAGMFNPDAGDITIPKPDSPPEALQPQIDAIKEWMTTISRKVDALEAAVQ